MHTDIIEDFEREALRIINEGEKEGIVLRLMGACAIKMHCREHKSLFEEMKRTLTDLDFMTYSKYSQYLTKFFKSLGYQPNEIFIQMHGHSRHIYLDSIHKRIIDVFFDRLSFSHTINFKNRLEINSPTITLADLLLEKMQIAHINQKDIKDSIILLVEHDIGESERELVNGNYIAEVLSNDWGFYYTVTTNLKIVRDYLEKIDLLNNEVKETVKTRIENLLKRIEDKPKSFRWRLRAKIGTSKKWYSDVEEVER